MTNAKTVLLIAIVLSLTSSPVLAVVEFKDGQTHNIDYEINDDVWVDHYAPATHTTVNLLEGGSINGLLLSYQSSEINMLGGFAGSNVQAWDTSHINMSSGSIGGDLEAWESSLLEISGGSIPHNVRARHTSQVDITGGSIGLGLWALEGSQVDIFGGSIIGWLCASGSSQVNISGGSIGGYLALWDESILTINGWGFVVDGQPFGYGELTSISGGWWQDEPVRHLTGTLASGELIDNDFYIGHDASILLVSEWALMVEIDIKPGSYPNAINLASHGLIPVAILSDEQFDATSVDPDTVELAGASVVKRGKGNKFMAHKEDIDGDGLLDLMVQVATEDLDPDSFQNGYAVLTGETYDGQPIEGWDEITIVPPEEPE